VSTTPESQITSAADSGWRSLSSDASPWIEIDAGNPLTPQTCSAPRCAESARFLLRIMMSFPLELRFILRGGLISSSARTGSVMTIYGVATKGSKGDSCWVTTYQVKWSTNQITWTSVMYSGGPSLTFPANIDPTSLASLLFASPVEARQVPRQTS
jgi:hypothetical protein